MGKNTVTEDDLLAGVGGGFGNMGKFGTGRPVRDNPFRDTRSEPAQEAPQASPAKPLRESKREERPAQEPVTAKARPTLPQAPASQAAPPPEVEERVAPPALARAPKQLRALKKQRKSDTYSEKMSTFLSPDMRDSLEMTARLLHRNRLVKGESITAHTLIRSGVRVITELLEFSDADVVSSEEELDALIRKKLGA